MIDYSPLCRELERIGLAEWAGSIPDQVNLGLSPERYGDIPRWRTALAGLPAIDVAGEDLDRPAIRVRARSRLDDATRSRLEEALRELHPWRKGPFDLFGIYIDTEWRSDWKWDRLRSHISPLTGRRVLDVGCGNGYHCWRMRGAGAELVLGVDPAPLFVLQYWALAQYIRDPAVWVLPLPMEQVPANLGFFDTVFSMGVLYHRRSPFDHLLALRDALRPGGELVLETLVIEGRNDQVLVPTGRYARMGNVWFIPSVAALTGWLRKAGLCQVQVISVSATTTEEQRSTDWMTFHSLDRFLDPSDSTRTLEGYPAPQRAIVVARRPL